MPMSRSSRLWRLVIALGVVLLIAVVARFARAAADVELGFGSLPTAQGWTYVNGGVAAAEGTVWSLSGGVLSFDTMPYLANTSGTGVSSFYQLSGVVTNSEPISIEMRARVLNWEGDGSSSVGGCLAFGFTQGSTLWAMGITTLPSRIYNVNGTVLSSAYDNTQFHNYRVEWTPSPLSMTYYVDGVPISTNTAGFAQAANRIYFGDATGASNAHAEITYYRFRQGSGVTAASRSTWGRIKALHR